jgi:hypothetical protein
LPTFTTPFTVRQFRIDGALRGSLQFGLSVMRIGGEWVETEFPTEDQAEAADLYFHGGHIHTIDDATAAILTAAGYEVSP